MPLHPGQHVRIEIKKPDLSEGNRVLATAALGIMQEDPYYLRRNYDGATGIVASLPEEDGTIGVLIDNDPFGPAPFFANELHPVAE